MTNLKFSFNSEVYLYKKSHLGALYRESKVQLNTLQFNPFITTKELPRVSVLHSSVGIF